MGGKLLGGAVAVLALASGVVRHAAWYVRHHVDGDPRRESEADREPGRG
ncbi:MAG: hypothetical protein ACR2GL_03750 [Thermoleophilaceae bacterium]